MTMSPLAGYLIGIIGLARRDVLDRDRRDGRGGPRGAS